MFTQSFLDLAQTMVSQRGSQGGALLLGQAFVELFRAQHMWRCAGGTQLAVYRQQLDRGHLIDRLQRATQLIFTLLPGMEHLLALGLIRYGALQPYPP